MPRDVNGQVLDAGVLNWLGVEFHQCQYFLRHTHFDGEAQRAGFTCGERIVVRPMAARKLIRKDFRGSAEPHDYCFMTVNRNADRPGARLAP